MGKDDEGLEELRGQFYGEMMAGARGVTLPQLFTRIEDLVEREKSRRHSIRMKALAEAIEKVLSKSDLGKESRGAITQVANLVRHYASDYDDAPRIVVKTLIIPGDKTEEGTLVKGVSRLWFEIMRRIKDDPDSIYQIGCWKWEEILAGAYKQDGWDIVTLTPKRGDHGIDVIAERKGWGQLRFLLLDQMKAYKPGHLIGPDEIREMKGVLLDHPEASKGLITTTADFTPGAIEAAKNLAPRLELRPHDKLVEWLASVAVEDLRSSETSQTGRKRGRRRGHH